MGRKTGEENDALGGITRLDFLRQFVASHSRKPEIRNHKVELTLVDFSERLGSVWGGVDEMAGGFENHFDRLQHHRIIVDDENASERGGLGQAFEVASF